MKLLWLGDAIVIDVNPQQQARKYRISFINDAVAVAAIFGLIEFSERQEAVRILGFRLIREVAEELLAIINLSIVVAVQRQEGIARVGGGPCEFYRVPVSCYIEPHPCIGGRQVKAFPGGIDNDRRYLLAGAIVPPNGGASL